MRVYKIWVEREIIQKDLFEIEADSLEDALTVAEAYGDEPEASIIQDDRVLDSWEDGSRGVWPEPEGTMIKRKLTLMTMPELRNHLEVWRGREQNRKENSPSWRICRWMVDRILEEIRFKDWLLDGLLIIEKREKEQRSKIKPEDN